MSDAPAIETQPTGPANPVPAVEGEPLAGNAAGATAGRRLPLSIAGSILFHAAIAAFFLISPTGRSIATKLAGLKADGTASFGSSRQESPTGSIGGKTPDAISVTLTPPPAPPRPKTKAGPPVKPVETARKQPTHPSEQPRPDKPHPSPAQPQRVLTARSPGPSDVAPVQSEKLPRADSAAQQPAKPQEPQPAPKAIEAEAKPPAKQAEATPQTPPSPIPVPMPRPRQMALAMPQTQTDATGSLFGTLGGKSRAPATGASNGKKEHGAGDAAVSNYPGTVARKLNASLRYPASARRRKLSGETRVQFVIDASGKIGAVRVLASSGSDILDKAAIETVKRAAPFPPIPAAAQRGDWPFSVSLAFGE